MIRVWPSLPSNPSLFTCYCAKASLLTANRPDKRSKASKELAQVNRKKKESKEEEEIVSPIEEAGSFSGGLLFIAIFHTLAILLFGKNALV